MLHIYLDNIEYLKSRRCRGSIFSFNLNLESWKEKEKIREKIFAGGNPVVLQPASNQHVLLHSSLLPTYISLINVRSVLTNLLLKGPVYGEEKNVLTGSGKKEEKEV